MNQNVKLIQKLRDNAELAQAAYGYFHLLDKQFNNDSAYGDKSGKQITLTDIINMDYKGYVTTEHTTFIIPEKLKGDFTATQAKQFFKRYELVEHIPDDKSGFSATIFYDKINSNYTIAFRGTK